MFLRSLLIIASQYELHDIMQLILGGYDQYIHSKEPYTHSKEPYIPLKESYKRSKEGACDRELCVYMTYSYMRDVPI